MTEDGSAGTGTSGKKASVDNSRSSKGLCLHCVTDAPPIRAISKSLGINVNRGVAKLHSGQAFKIREAVANGRVRREIPPMRFPEPSREPPRREFAHATCSCCRYLFRYQVEPESESTELCKACYQHFQQDGESFVRTHTRLEEHEALSRSKVEEYREKCK